MEIKSPLANFVDVLKQIYKTAQTHNVKLSGNEAATRAALIDPILRTLGWDLANPDMIELEKAWQQTRIDYALMDNSGRVHTIIEAKKLGTNLNNPVSYTQLVNYAIQYGIQNVVLTDGVIWHHYLQFVPGQIRPEIFDLENDPVIRCAEFFISKLDAYHYWPGSLPVTVPLVQNPVNPPPPLPGPNFVPLNSLPANLQGRQAPQQLRLPDGQIVQVKSWASLLIECTKFVLTINPALQLPLPDQPGGGTMLIQTSQPADVTRYSLASYQGATVYIHKNYSANNCVAKAKYILGFLPQGGNWQPVAVS